jgi:hypothetical protein
LGLEPSHLMRLCWLSFKGGRAVIVRAETLVHARLVAAADEVVRAHLFDAGFQVDPEFEQMIPDDLIGRTAAHSFASRSRHRGDRGLRLHSIHAA